MTQKIRKSKAASRMECPYCMQIPGVGDTPLSVKSPPTCFDIILFSDRSTVVVPTVGMITPGYVLIVSRRHQLNFSHCSSVHLKGLDKFIKYVKHKLEPLFGKYLVFEHGPYSSSFKAGCCIEHAHLHLIPKCEQMQKVVMKSFQWQQLQSLDNLKSVVQNRSYLLVGLDKEYFISLDPNVPSQWVRRCLTDTIRSSQHWDWAVDAGRHELNETLCVLHRHGILHISDFNSAVCT